MKSAFLLIVMLMGSDGTATIAEQEPEFHTDGLEIVQTAEACDAIAAAQESRMLLAMVSSNGIYTDVKIYCVTKKGAKTLHKRHHNK
jgi:hypothetical protein